MHTTGSYYLNADTMAFMQLILSDVLKDFPTLKLIIPHGGGAVPFHWGRFRGLALNNGRPELVEIMKNNIFFDTCVYHQPGINLLTEVVPVENILFASRDGRRGQRRRLRKPASTSTTLQPLHRQGAARLSGLPGNPTPRSSKAMRAESTADSGLR